MDLPDRRTLLGITYFAHTQAIKPNIVGVDV